MSKQGAMQFFLLVAEMRKAQKDYFRARNHGALIRSRELERQVDGYIERGMKYIDDNTPKQGDLFGKGVQ